MPEPAYPSDGNPPSKRNSIAGRLLGSFREARKDTSASVQRRASIATKQQNPVVRIKEWLDTCNGQHDHHCSGTDESDAVTWRPVWLIDSVERNLVRAKPTDRYLALSYVWGTAPRRNDPDAPAQLLRSNVDAFQLSLPDKGIPQTILDAMWLSKKLGLRFLWVDRLCIVQDDEEEFNTHIRRMPFVFSNAYLTIIAAYGDVHTGLVPLNPRRPPRAARAGSRDHNDLLLQSRWNSRGWTLQELLYSRRAIFFFEDVVTWECHCDLWQGSPTSVMKSLRGNRHTCTNAVASGAFGFHHAPWPDLDEYARIASDYSGRRVTFVEDTLKAFSGITQMLSRVYPGGFVNGMPLMFLDIALLWRPSAAIRRRAVTRPPFLPSWTWMGWWFDNIPVDLVLWRAAADYVEDTKIAKRGQASKRFQPTHSFKIRPTVTWNLTDRTARIPVPNTGLQYRDMKSRRTPSAALPPGWSKAGSLFKHDSDETTSFRYPIPVEDPPEAGEYEPPTGEMAFPGPFLSFQTQSAYLEVDFALTLAPKDRLNPGIAVGNIWGRSGKWIGEFRAHDGWLGIQSSNYDGDEKLEFIAISSATERRGSYVFNPERFEEHMDDSEAIHIVNVLWIERIGEVAYRRGLGHILQRAWDAHAEHEVPVLLG
ncbi:hypothetical protein HJFPF1_02898 [Paramyrothecium foliicola]|nr:hypothetical protein HJFPF1_02898 [Paramyrothecium foliicola]